MLHAFVLRFQVFGWMCFSTLCLAAQPPVAFKLSVMDTPSALEPLDHRQSINSYLLNSIYRSLFTYRNGELVPELASECRFDSDTLITCRLKAKLKYNNGTPIVASDFVRTFQRAFAKKALVTDALLSLRNARAILAGKAKIQELGVKAPAPDRLVFELERTDREFLYNLIDPAFAPRPQQTLDRHFSGPFVVQEIKKGKSVYLKSNEHFHGGGTRPDVEVLAVPSDDTGLRLYETGVLHLLRRMTTDAVSKYKDRPDFKFVPLLRFDYVGFGPQLKKHPELRKRLSASVDYDSFVKIFNPLGRAGCPGIPKELFKDRPCLSQNLKGLKKEPSPVPLVFNIALAGGDDISRQAEWFQNQWKIHAGIDVTIEPLELTVMTLKLKNDPPPIFRRGVPLERPTCLGALETFQKNGPNNFIRFEDAEYERVLDKMRATDDKAAKKTLCSEGMKRLLTTHQLIPLGEIHYAMMQSPEFAGVEINNLNQLFLDSLRHASNSR